MVVGVGDGWDGCAGVAGRGCGAPCWVLKEQPGVGVSRLSAFRGERGVGVVVSGARHDLAFHTARVCGLVGGGGCGLVVGCELHSGREHLVYSVVKLLRADGGCLGIRSR